MSVGHPSPIWRGAGVRLKNGKVSPFQKVKPFVQPGFLVGLDEKWKPYF